MNSAEYLFIIYSCQKNLVSAITLRNLYFEPCKSWLASMKMSVIVMYGDPQLNSDFELNPATGVLKLRVIDDYHNLANKTLMLFKTIYHVFPNIKGVFKCDDDVIININSLNYFINDTLKNHPIHYAGMASVTEPRSHDDAHLMLRNISNAGALNTPFSMFCGGPLYFVSNTGLRAIAMADNSVTSIYYEDKMVGYILNQHHIYPVMSMIYSDDCRMFKTCSYHNADKKPTLFIRLHGGLGNQMFQAAAAMEISKKNNMNCFILNTCKQRPYDFTHIVDNKTLFETVFKHFPVIDAENLNMSLINCVNEDPNLCFSYSNYTFSKNVLLNGYFICPEYFSDENAVKTTFLSNSVYRNLINNGAERLYKNKYFIHVRRGDYVGLDVYDFDKDTYYKSALKYLRNIDKNAEFVVFSDDIKWCKQYALFIHPNIIFYETTEDPLISMYTMSLCEKGGICANSTFSWWGGYLNLNNNKVVVYPKSWINRGVPVNVYPKQPWVKIL